MSRFSKVSPERKKQIFAYNKQRAADSAAARDMQALADRIGKLPRGQLKKVLDEDTLAILAKYGVEV